MKVTTDDQEVEINTGDIIFFPKGLKCRWHVIEKIRKVSTFDLQEADVK
ncbi:MAG: cupin domain-containing protein [Candidatus Eremiobacteraeota bacterium]|nr:cupin domain-containing protein [Candidatus Eremiobacteraeota bacterium]